MKKIEFIPYQQTIPLRHQILRPHQSIDECIYPGDKDPSSVHLGAYSAKDLVGIVSLYREDKLACGWRLRGMATAESVRGQGYGKDLVEACIDFVSKEEVRGIWCNARTPACAFYEKLGFSKHGAEFEIQGIGPHYIMTYRE
tara:strand:- start:7378 stop:7803 length:426 start_codon:yes stop_codon:yes gene_type:complete